MSAEADPAARLPMTSSHSAPAHTEAPLSQLPLDAPPAQKATILPASVPQPLADAAPAGHEVAPSLLLPAQETTHTQASPEALQPPSRLDITGFGEAYLSLDGAIVRMRKTAKELALALLLADQAASAPTSGRELPWVQRAHLVKLLWPLAEDAALQTQSVNQCKFSLTKRLREAGLAEKDWLESRSNPTAFRLRPAVHSDLTVFLGLARKIAEAERQRHKAPEALPPQIQLNEWRRELAALYQGGFALQFELDAWAIGIRNRYRLISYEARFDAAKLLAASGTCRAAIDEATALLFAAEAPVEKVLTGLIQWLQEEGGFSELDRWQREYRRRYAHTFSRELARDHPELDELLLRALHRA